jgi:hypothetical protein
MMIVSSWLQPTVTGNIIDNIIITVRLFIQQFGQNFEL